MEEIDQGQVRPGTITNNGHPGNPVQEVLVAGFAEQTDALAFVAGGFDFGKRKPVVKAALRRGASVKFAGASFLVFYYQVAPGPPTLLSITRCHEDLHLVIESCGYQFLLGVRTSAPEQKVYPIR